MKKLLVLMCLFLFPAQNTYAVESIDLDGKSYDFILPSIMGEDIKDTKIAEISFKNCNECQFDSEGEDLEIIGTYKIEFIPKVDSNEDEIRVDAFNEMANILAPLHQYAALVILEGRELELHTFKDLEDFSYYSSELWYRFDMDTLATDSIFLNEYEILGEAIWQTN